MKKVKIEPKELNGEISIPPSKSISHRAVIAASLSSGVSEISNIVMSKDIKATCEAMKQLGAEISEVKAENERVKLIIKGIETFKAPQAPIDCNESGSTLRFMIPIAMMSNSEISFIGKGKLVERPLDVYYKIFDEQGIHYETKDNKLPLKINGSLTPSTFDMRGDVSSQFITGLMFVLPLLDSDSKITITGELESKGYIDLTISVLSKYGIVIENDDYKAFYIKGRQVYKACDYRVEGDFSQAAFWLVAGCLGEKITSRDLNESSLQADKEVIDIIKSMGGKISCEDNSFIAHKCQTKQTVIDASQIPDIIPVLSVLASVSEGTTIVKNGARLRIKESDRLTATKTELNKLGADIKEEGDTLIIKGVSKLRGANVDSWNDHRIAMAMAVASIRCEGSVIIDGASSVDKSYPNFWQDFKMLGGDICEQS